MNRQEKIRLLKAVKLGILKPEDLTPKTHGAFFSRYLENDGSFERDGKVYSAEEHKAYLEALKQRNERLRAAGLPEENVITVIYKSDERNAPILD
jgi:hypothetical protein